MLENMLKRSDYDVAETEFLVDGFKNGFDFHYHGPCDRSDTSHNLPFRVGDKYDLWEKVMKEIKAKRFAGPYVKIPYRKFIQSPIGLVPKVGGQTRLIFHLSYNFDCYNSFNYYTPEEYCSVTYQDLDYAVKCCLAWCGTNMDETDGADNDENCQIFLSKADIHSAFRVILGQQSGWPWTILKVTHPVTGRVYYCIDKNLLFGASISCALFQRFSNALHHLVEVFSGCPLSATNYLDDYLFCAPSKQECNALVSIFMQITHDLGLTVAEEKTEWGTERLIFLGILIIGNKLLLSVPKDKRLKALNYACMMMDKRKSTIHDLQKFTGYLNFICKAVFPGRAFTRRMYAKIPWFNSEGNKMKQHYHVNLDSEFKEDCKVWVSFLQNDIPASICRPFVDLTLTKSASELDFYMDSSANPLLGFGGYFGEEWFAGTWDPRFILECSPSIEFLELYAMTVGILLWSEWLSNSRVKIFTDNKTAWDILNNSSSSCKNCMVLVRKIVLTELKFNVRIFAEYVKGICNKRADFLSRQKIHKFKKLTPFALPEP